MFLYIIIIALLFFLLIPFLNIQIETKAFIKKNDSYSLVTIRLFRGFIRFSFNIAFTPNKKRIFSFKLKEKVPVLEDQSSIEDIFKLIKRTIKGYGYYKIIILDIVRKIKFEKLLLKIIIGSNDAAHTALATGGLYTVLHLFVLHLVNKYSLKDYEIKVFPHYHGELFELNMDCIINIKLGDIIIAGFKIIIRKLKGGENVVRASNRKCYEDYYGKS